VAAAGVEKIPGAGYRVAIRVFERLIEDERSTGTTIRLPVNSTVVEATWLPWIDQV
tara:strand:+ start:13679 stop:13846 length:168 start_codon:yes stop_codon:yes gene_type:complete